MANVKRDTLQVLLETVSEPGTDFCGVGGLPINAYAESVVGLDLEDKVTAANTR